MGYESDITQFMRDLLAKNPDLAEQRRSLRATWWDKPQDEEILRQRRESAVKMNAYPYYSDPALSRPDTPSKPE